MTTRKRTEAFRMLWNLHLFAIANLFNGLIRSPHFQSDDAVVTRLPILVINHQQIPINRRRRESSTTIAAAAAAAAMSRIPLPLVISYSFLAGVFFCLFTGLSLKTLPACRSDRAQEDYSINSRKLGFGNNNNNNNDSQIESPKFLGFVGVQTSFSSADRRAALRSTWFPSNTDALRRLELTTGLAFRFVIGRSKDAKMMADLEEEIKRYSGFLLIDVEEEYLNRANKTLAFFKAAYAHFEADYFVKADDDIYLRPDRLKTLLAKERTDPMTYIGCMKRGRVITDPQMTWFEKSRHLIANENFLYGYGSIYVLSEEIVAALAVARNNSLRMFSNEDVTIGLWMLSMNVNHEDNRALCDPQCSPTSIAVWDLPGCPGLCNPVNRLKELHKISICSKSPTLPS